MTNNNDVPKMPSMKHLPWSEEDARQQKWLSMENVKEIFKGNKVVMLEKLDGSNACLTQEKVYARSHSGEPHREEWDYLKRKHRNDIRYKIPEDMAVFGEYLYARHSIKYTDLPAYFVVFGVYSKSLDAWYDWEATKAVAEKLDLPHAPELGGAYFGAFDWENRDPEGTSEYGDTREGYVVRKVKAFRRDALHTHMAKCVRENHVRTEELHWRKGGETDTNDLA